MKILGPFLKSFPRRGWTGIRNQNGVKNFAVQLDFVPRGIVGPLFEKKFKKRLKLNVLEHIFEIVPRSFWEIIMTMRCKQAAFEFSRFKSRGETL